MEVLANGEVVTLPDRATVADLVEALGLGARWVLVERNGEPVPRDQRDSVQLAEGDRIELVRAVAGG